MNSKLLRVLTLLLQILVITICLTICVYGIVVTEDIQDSYPYIAATVRVSILLLITISYYKTSVSAFNPGNLFMMMAMLYMSITELRILSYFTGLTGWSFLPPRVGVWLQLFSQFMLCFSAVVILAAGSVFERAEAMKQNWNENGGSTVYINRNGSIVRNDWVSTDGETYYMQADGKPVTGIAVINRRTYFFDQAGRLINDGWFSSQGKRYYIQNGNMLKGWHTLYDRRYYFDGDGCMHTG